MKKVFLFLATAALFASCSDDMLESGNGFQASNEKGITFQVVNDATRGMIDPAASYNAFFFAEKDRINIWSSNALNSSSVGTSWGNDAVMYKATKSQGNPNFTAINDDNLLKFKPFAKDDKGNVTSNANFFVAYPTGQNVTHFDKTDKIAEHFEITATDLSAQSIGTYMNMDKRLMYDYVGGVGVKDAKADVKDANASVGEKVNMTLKSPLSTILFKCEDVETYNNTLGKLQSITITSQYSPLVPNVTEGSYDVQGEDKVTATDKKSYLLGDVVPKEYETVTRTDGTKVSKIKTYEPKKDVKEAPTSVDITPDIFTYDLNDNVAWVSNSKGIVKRTATLEVKRQIKNTDEMNLFVLPAKHETGKGENYTITYEFEKATLKYDWPTEAPLTANTGAVRFKLNIAQNFDYIVTSDEKSLIVNKGQFSKIFDKEGNVIWNGSTVKPSNFETILINVEVEALGDEDFKKLVGFGNVTSLTIKNKTKTLGEIQKMEKLSYLEAPNIESVSKSAFAKVQASTLTTMKLPMVASFESQEKFDETTSFTALTNLDLHSFEKIGGDGQISPNIFFNLKTAETLEIIDISALTSLEPTFDAHKGIFFENYSKLDTLKLNPNGVTVNAYQFKNCYALKTLTGAIDISSAEGAFYCDVLPETKPQLTSVNLACTKIPDYAFYGTAVKSIKKADGNTNVQPESVGQYAFANAKIETLDLTLAKTIGKFAFNNATAFKGTANAKVELIVETVEENAFNGTAITSFRLKNAKSTKALSLNSSTLEQIKYDQDLDESKTGDKKVISDTQVVDRKTNTYIFVNNEGDKSLFTGYYSVTVSK